jgi:hypothetical protein
MMDDGHYAEALYYGQPIQAVRDPVTGQISYQISHDGGVTYVPMPADAMQPRWTYIQQFFQRHLKSGLPFVFVDITERTTWNPNDPYNISEESKYLARITDLEIPMTQSAKDPKRWGWTLNIMQVRPSYNATQD